MEAVNLTAEMNGNLRRRRVRKGPKAKWDESQRGTGKALGVPMWEQLALQPPPPCDHPSLGRCPFYERCKVSGEICSAFTKYVNSKFYTGGKDRKPNRHFDDLYYDDSPTSLDRTNQGSIILSEAKGTVHADIAGLEARHERSPPQAGSTEGAPQGAPTVHTDSLTS